MQSAFENCTGHGTSGARITRQNSLGPPEENSKEILTNNHISFDGKIHKKPNSTNNEKTNQYLGIQHLESSSSN